MEVDVSKAAEEWNMVERMGANGKRLDKTMRLFGVRVQLHACWKRREAEGHAETMESDGQQESQGQEADPAGVISEEIRFRV